MRMMIMVFWINDDVGDNNNDNDDNNDKDDKK